MSKLFVFGTLKRGRGNHRLLEDAEFLGEATLKNFEMFSFGGFPGIRPAEGKQVKGELYDVKHFRNLDLLEGCRARREDSFYFREDVSVGLHAYDESGDAQLVECQTYVPQGDFSEYKEVPGGEW